MNEIAYFEIQAADPPAAIRFYEAAFGWRFTKLEGLPIDYWRIETDGMHGGLLQRPAPAPPQQCGANAYVCSMQVADFDATAARILEAGGIVAMPKFAIAGLCWHGYFLDPQGNTFGIFQPDPAAA